MNRKGERASTPLPHYMATGRVAIVAAALVLAACSPASDAGAAADEARQLNEAAEMLDANNAGAFAAPANNEEPTR